MAGEAKGRQTRSTVQAHMVREGRQIAGITGKGKAAGRGYAQ
jgi:hypothetical protein